MSKIKNVWKRPFLFGFFFFINEMMVQLFQKSENNPSLHLYNLVLCSWVYWRSCQKKNHSLFSWKLKHSSFWWVDLQNHFKSWFGMKFVVPLKDLLFIFRMIKKIFFSLVKVVMGKLDYLHFIQLLFINNPFVLFFFFFNCL